MKFSKKPSGSQQSIRVSQGTYQKALLTKFLSQLIVAIIGLLLVYVCFAATIVRFVPSSAGIILTKNNTYPGAEIPEKAQVLISLSDIEVKTGLADRLKQAFIPQKPSALVQILAGPDGRVKWTGGLLTVNNLPLSVPFPQNPDLKFLEGQYVSVCLKGDCTPGTSIIFKTSQTIGVAIEQNVPVPPPPTINENANSSRATAENAVRTFIIEGYNGNSKAACLVLTKEYKAVLGGDAGCEAKARFWGAKLGREYDFSKLVTKFGKSNKLEAVVEYTLPGAGRGVTVTGKYVLTVDKNGWSIAGEG